MGLPARFGASWGQAQSSWNKLKAMLEGPEGLSALLGKIKTLEASLKAAEAAIKAVEARVTTLENPPSKLRAFGRVTSAGAKTSGEGFTVSKTATGTYKVTLSVESPIAPAVKVTPDTTAIIPAWTAKNITKTTFEVAIWNESGLGAADCAFSFWAWA